MVEADRRTVAGTVAAAAEAPLPAADVFLDLVFLFEDLEDFTLRAQEGISSGAFAAAAAAAAAPVPFGLLCFPCLEDIVASSCDCAVRGTAKCLLQPLVGCSTAARELTAVTCEREVALDLEKLLRGARLQIYFWFGLVFYYLYFSLSLLRMLECFTGSAKNVVR